MSDEEIMGFGSQEEWERFNREFPKFVENYGSLEALRDKIFRRHAVGDKVARIIFGLGRVCSEDFQQALVLCGNGFGIGGLQVIRGMYERLVTAAFLMNQPDKVDDFIDYYFVQRRRGLNTLRDIYNADELAKMIPPDKQEKVEREYQETINEGRFTV